VTLRQVWRRFGDPLNLDHPRRNFARQTDDGTHFVDRDSGSNDTALSRRLREIHLEPAFNAGARNVADPVPHAPQCLGVRAGEASRLRCFPYRPQLKRHKPLCLPASRVMGSPAFYAYAREGSAVLWWAPRERGPAGASGRGGYGVPSRSGGEVERQRAETNELEHPVWSPCGLASEEGRDPSWLGVPVSRGNPLGRCVTTRADLLTSPSHLSH
jgi:hypothetical protein